MALVNQSEFARIAGVSRVAICQHIKAGALVLRPDKRLDTDSPVNSEYIKKCKYKLENKEQKPLEVRTKTPKKAHQGRKKQNNETDEIDPDNLPDDISKCARFDLDRIKVAEQILDLRMRRDVNRGELISRKLVRTVFSRIYEIDMNEFLTAKEKLMPDIASIFGCNDPNIIMRAGERMDEELWKILKHIQAEINKFLQNMGSEQI
jgi:hypothetical protein